MIKVALFVLLGLIAAAYLILYFKYNRYLRIPSDPGQSFRRKPATCSERRRPAIPS